MILAQNETVRRGLLKVFDYIADLDFPSPQQFVGHLQELDKLQAVLLVLVGAAMLIYGFKYFKLFVVANAAAVGGLCGMYLGQKIGTPNMPLLLGLAGAVLLGVVAYPSLKYFVCGMGGLAGGLVGFALWCFVANGLQREALRQYAWAGGIIGMIAVGMLAWVAFRLAVMIFTAVQGSALTVSGLCSILLAYASPAEWLQENVLGSPTVLSLVIGVPAAAGFALQFATDAAKIQKKRKATEKPPV